MWGGANGVLCIGGTNSLTLSVSLKPPSHHHHQHHYHDNNLEEDGDFYEGIRESVLAHSLVGSVQRLIWLAGILGIKFWWLEVVFLGYEWCLREVVKKEQFQEILPRPKIEKQLGSSLFNFSRRATRDTDRMEIRKYYGHLTWVGARDTCVSKN